MHFIFFIYIFSLFQSSNIKANVKRVALQWTYVISCDVVRILWCLKTTDWIPNAQISYLQHLLLALLIVIPDISENKSRRPVEQNPKKT